MPAPETRSAALIPVDEFMRLLAKGQGGSFSGDSCYQGILRIPLVISLSAAAKLISYQFA